jgi:hypothetical protein
MSILYVVTLYCDAGADLDASQKALPIYRFAIESADRGDAIARSCMSALRRQHTDLEFSHDIRAIVLVTPQTEIFEVVSEVLEIDEC